MDLQRLSDRAEIIDLLTAYTRAVDTGDFAGIDRVFTPDAVLDYTSPGGPRGSVAQAKEFLESLRGFERWQHVLGQIELTFPESEQVPDTAQALAYFTNPLVSRDADGTEHVWLLGGYYRHTLRRTAEGWRSVEMVDEIVWSRPD